MYFQIASYERQFHKFRMVLKIDQKRLSDISSCATIQIVFSWRKMFVPDDRLGWYMEIYEDWFFSRGVFSGGGTYVAEGYSSRASGGMIVSWNRDSDSLYADVCRRCAEAVSAIVDELPQPEQIAIRVKHCEVKAVFRLREPIEVVYGRALQLIKRGLLRRGFE